MKVFGIADVIHELKITETSEGITLKQSHYTDKILEKFNKDNNNEA